MYSYCTKYSSRSGFKLLQPIVACIILIYIWYITMHKLRNFQISKALVWGISITSSVIGFPFISYWGTAHQVTMKTISACSPVDWHYTYLYYFKTIYTKIIDLFRNLSLSSQLYCKYYTKEKSRKMSLLNLNMWE